MSESHDHLVSAETRYRQSPTGSSVANAASHSTATSATSHPNVASSQKYFTLARRIGTGAAALGMSYLFAGTSLNELFQYHPITMTISFVGLMPEITALTNVIRRQRSVADREDCINQHLGLSVFMKLLSIIGFIAITVNKNKRGKNHYTTWHGKIGLATFVILVLQVIFGFVYHFRLFGGGMASLAKWRKVHKWLGILLLLSGSASMWLGMRTHFVERAVQSDVANFVFGIVTFIACAIAYYKE